MKTILSTKNAPKANRCWTNHPKRERYLRAKFRQSSAPYLIFSRFILSSAKGDFRTRRSKAVNVVCAELCYSLFVRDMTSAVLTAHGS